MKVLVQVILLRMHIWRYNAHIMLVHLNTQIADVTDSQIERSTAQNKLVRFRMHVCRPPIAEVRLECKKPEFCTWLVVSSAVVSKECMSDGFKHRPARQFLTTFACSAPAFSPHRAAAASVLLGRQLNQNLEAFGIALII